MHIRQFTVSDAEFCCRVRNRAFIVEFRRELSPPAIAAAVNAYLPADYVRMSHEGPVFIVEEREQPIGFFTLKRAGPTRAELPLIYLNPEHMGQGIGRRCVAYMENWIQANWPGVATLFVDTVIPDYNGGFYRKAGFQQVGEAVCHFPGESLPAVRFEKHLGP